MNEQLLLKADMALSDLTSNGGYLTPEQNNQFIRVAIDQPTILNQARVVVMTRPQMEINKIGFGNRIMRKATESTALSAGDRSAATTSKINLETKEIIAEVRLPYTVIEDNIEGGNVNFGGPANDANGGIIQTILDLIAQRAATDLEELALLGDTTSGDTYLALVDGWLKKAGTNHTVDHAAAAINRTMFKNGLLALPNKYKRDLPNMRHFVSPNNHIEYNDQLAGRETAMGDAKHQQIAPLFGSGVRLDQVALMPDTGGLLTNPRNLILGIQRNISLEWERLISERVYKFVLTARVDCQVEETDALVQYTNILAP